MENHRVQEMMRLMASKIRSIAGTISDDDVETFIHELLSAKRVYVIGAGRSGLVAKAFAMRLMHLGLKAYVVGETITPAMNVGDVMVVFQDPAGQKRSLISPRPQKKSAHTYVLSVPTRTPVSAKSPIVVW